MKFSLEGKSLRLNSAADAANIVIDLHAAAPDDGLEEIVLSGNTFGVDAARAVAEALRKKKNLKIANLSDIFTGRLKDEIPLALDAFVDALVDKENLGLIDLCDNAFGPAGAAPVRRLFVENHAIATLKLNNNGLGIEGGRLIATSLNEAAKANAGVLPNMRTIIMGRNRLETAAAKHLSLLAFPVLPNLTELRMPQNGIRPEGIEVLVQALGAHCFKLEVLDLQDNTFTESGSVALSKSLPNWPNLRTLNVSDCLLGKGGSKVVVKALTPATVAPRLETLLLAFNEMDLSGARLVPEMLANKSIKTLHLNGNMFDADDEVVEKIQAALARGGGVLDDLDDMEEPDSEDENDASGDESEGVDASDNLKKAAVDATDVDALADVLGGKLSV
ncbi:hypothetical protein HDU83_003733 [Entophlyctis luteolus]|nr:hypothetical protein HDU83_003733 [Entophlyctis luteolus]